MKYNEQTNPTMILRSTWFSGKRVAMSVDTNRTKESFFHIERIEGEGNVPDDNLNFEWLFNGNAP